MSLHHIKRSTLRIILIIFMKTTRARQFNNTRDKHLSEPYSQMGQTAGLITSSRTTRLEPSYSAFIKNKTPLCLNCTNHKLAQSRKEREFRDKGKQLQEQRKAMQKAKLQNQQVKAGKVRQAKEVDLYNMSISRKQLNSVKSEKQFDKVWVHQNEQRQKELKELQADVSRLRKEKELRYRSELQQQLQHEQARKEQIKLERLTTMPEQPIVNDSKINPEALHYGEDLKRQIEKDRQRKQQQKYLQTELNLRQLSTTQQKFMEFTQFKYPKKQEANPELFEEMKKTQMKKKMQKLQNRCLQEHERKAALKKQKESLEQSAKEELQKMRKYADTLSAQIAQKKREDEYRKKEDTRELLSSRYSQEFVGAVRTKECGECHSEVREAELSYI